MSGAPQLPALGDVLGGRYLLMQRLRARRDAPLFRARDQHSKIDVALELLTPRALGHPQQERRLLDEARCLERLRGTPGVVSLIDHGRFSERHDWPYLATALHEGRTLAAILSERRFVGPQLRELSVALAKALAACHAKGVVLGALHPAKISLTLAPIRVQLFDFAGAQLHAGATPPPPASADVSSFGALLYELITARPPPAPGELALDAWAYEVHSEWGELLADCAEPDPARRPDMLELIDRLEHIPLHSDEGESTDRVTFSEIQARASSDYPRAPNSEDSTTRRQALAPGEDGPTRIMKRTAAPPNEDGPTRVMKRHGAPGDEDGPTRVMKRHAHADAQEDAPTRLIPTRVIPARQAPDDADDAPTRVMQRLPGQPQVDEDEPTRMLPRLAPSQSSPLDDAPTRLMPRLSRTRAGSEELPTQVYPRTSAPPQSRLTTAPMPALRDEDIPRTPQSEQRTEQVPAVPEQPLPVTAVEPRRSVPLAPRAGELRAQPKASARGAVAMDKASPPQVHTGASLPAHTRADAKPKSPAWLLPLFVLLGLACVGVGLWLAFAP